MQDYSYISFSSSCFRWKFTIINWKKYISRIKILAVFNCSFCKTNTAEPLSVIFDSKTKEWAAKSEEMQRDQRLNHLASEDGVTKSKRQIHSKCASPCLDCFQSQDDSLSATAFKWWAHLVFHSAGGSALCNKGQNMYRLNTQANPPSSTSSLFLNFRREHRSVFSAIQSCCLFLGFFSIYCKH